MGMKSGKPGKSQASPKRGGKREFRQVSPKPTLGLGSPGGAPKK